MLEIIKEDAFRKKLKSGLSGGYLFFGDEDYMKAFSVQSARKAICTDETFALFNDMKIEVLDYSAGALLDALMPLPMMSEQKIVTVNGLNISALKARELDDLCDALGALREYDYNVLIISVPADMIEEGNLPKFPSAVLKRLGEYLTLVHFESVTGARLVSWVGKHFEAEGVSATPEVCSYLINYAGKSMYTLSNETQKLAYYVLSHGRGAVTKEDIVAVSVAEISTDAFTLANALLDGRTEDAVNALSVMKFRRVDPIILFGEISRVICDLISVKVLADEGCTVSEITELLKMKSEYKTRIYFQGASKKTLSKLKAMLDACVTADSEIKHSQQVGYIAIEKLVCGM